MHPEDDLSLQPIAVAFNSVEEPKNINLKYMENTIRINASFSSSTSHSSDEFSFVDFETAFLVILKKNASSEIMINYTYKEKEETSQR